MVAHVSPALLVLLLELLLLGIVQDSFNLLVRILHQRLSLLAALLLTERRVTSHCLHLRVSVLKNGQYLLLLVRRQGQLSG